MVELVLWNDRWPMFVAFTFLLGVYLLILGIALAGLVSAIREREAEGKARKPCPTSHSSSDP